MHEGTPTGRDPSPAARVGYHSGKGLATKITCADCRDFGRCLPHSRHASESWHPAVGERSGTPAFTGVTEVVSTTGKKNLKLIYTPI
jgi:hypothetical protein